MDPVLGPKASVVSVTIKGPAAVFLREACERLQMPASRFIRDATIEKLKRMGYTVVD